MHFLVTGGTGTVGTELGIHLTRLGHSITLLCRDVERTRVQTPFPCQIIAYEKNQLQLDIAIDGVIHLAGQPIADHRWTDDQKKKIIESRGPYAEKLIAELKRQHRLPKLWIQASAIGFYAESKPGEVLNEQSPKANGFLGDTCASWESPGLHLPENIRAVIFRFGVILAKRGGFLKKMLPLFKFGVGSAVGNGKQIISWVHLDDVVQAIVFAIEHEKIAGIYNVCAPETITNQYFSQTLAKILNKSLLPNVPAFCLKLAYGPMSQVALNSQNVTSKKLENSGFKFKYHAISDALNQLIDFEKNPLEFEIFAREWLAHPRAKVFAFFCDETNLEKLTPEFLNFKVDKKSTKNIGKGTLIDYRLKIHGFPARWKTLIDEWIPNEKFVDTQLKGPYSKWHHTHLFEDLAAGTLITDRVVYKLPMNVLGLPGLPLVKNDVKNIFAYRKKIIGQVFVKN